MLNVPSTRERLQAFDFGPLFVEELGWEPPASRKVESGKVKDLAYSRKPVARLSGVGVFEIAAHGGAVPDAKTRAAIHKQVSEHCYENLLIFTDTARSQSLWYWVKREAGKRYARDHLYVKGQPGDLFLGKLAGHGGGHQRTGRGRQHLHPRSRQPPQSCPRCRARHQEVLREFDAQRLEFIEHIQGIDDDHQRRWYASVLLNRLMFIYFLQKKRFLDGGNRELPRRQTGAEPQTPARTFYSVISQVPFL